MEPTSAILAVTLNCNARCTMCDIWQNRMHDEMRPEEYDLLPDSLTDINISGGEPFLREDLPEILAVLHRTCPRARLVISTNGFLPARIHRLVRQALSIIPDLAVRVSIDGLHGMHDAVRGIPGGFEKCLETLQEMSDLGVEDLGIGFTILDQNLEQLPDVYRFSVEKKLQLSVTIATDSSIFFGTGKESLRPRSRESLHASLAGLAASEYRRIIPKHWFRGWYAESLIRYTGTGTRPLPCDAGGGFFYLDSLANVYGCHLLDNKMGNLRQASWDTIWSGEAAVKVRREAAGCNECWMVCTSKSAIRQRLPRIALSAAAGKLRSHLKNGRWG
ncbi:MAG: radical SAM protein [Acidobacteriota bacterium]